MFKEETGTQVGYVPAIILGIVLGLISTLGYILQRKSHLDNEKKPPDQRKHSFKRPLWHLGFWTYVIFATTASVVNLSNLPFFVILPLGSSTLIYNVMYSRWILKERVTRIVILGTFYIAAAAIAIGFCGYLPEPHRTTNEMLHLYLRPTFLVYQSCLLVACIATRYIMAIKHFSTRTNGILYALMGTIAASQAALFAKSGLSLLNQSIFGHNNQFNNPLAFIVIGLTFILPIIGLYLFNKSLARCETIVSIPITYCLSICLAVLNTFVYYDSLSSIETFKWIIICIALVYLFYGVDILAKCNVPHEDEMVTVQEEYHQPPVTSPA